MKNKSFSRNLIGSNDSQKAPSGGKLSSVQKSATNQLLTKSKFKYLTPLPNSANNLILLENPYDISNSQKSCFSISSRRSRRSSSSFGVGPGKPERLSSALSNSNLILSDYKGDVPSIRVFTAQSDSDKLDPY